MKTKLALIQQHIQEAQTAAKELADMCAQNANRDYIHHASDIEMGLEWTGRRTNDFAALLATQKLAN